MIHSTAIVGEPPESREFLRFIIDDHAGTLVGNFWDPMIEPTAHIAAYATVDAGKEGRTYVGPRSFIMKHVHVGHDALIQEDCEVAPGTVIAGYVILRRGVKVGVNASILPYVCVGEGAVIGAGAVVNRHVASGAVVAGVPAFRIDGPLTAFLEGPGDLRCGCWARTVRRPGGGIWDGCPYHGDNPVC